MRFVKPIDEELLAELSKNHQHLVTLEENTTQGGAGSAVNEFILSTGVAIPTLNLGLPDLFLDHGTRNELLRDAQLDAESILSSIRAFTTDT